jgi:hypothetical protein
LDFFKSIGLRRSINWKLDPSDVKLMMEHLVTWLEAQIGSLTSRMEADKEESRAEKKADKEERKADKEELMVRMNSNQEKTETAINSLQSCLGGTGACLQEEEELTPKETDSVEEPQVVPEGAAVEDKFGATEDRAGDPRLAVRRHRERKKRAQVNGGPRQKFAAFHGRVTRRAVPAVRKGHVRKEPGKKCHSGLRGQTKASRNGKRGRIVGRDQQPAVG